MAPGDHFGRYTIEALLGEGGMGTVYRAIDTKLQRRVALKLLRRAASSDSRTPSQGAERLLREARAAALLEHPNAVVVHDVGEVGETPYIAMELVAGRSLRTYIGDETVPLATRLRWLVEVARALGAAHARGVVHRDVKPENVMVRDDGTTKVLDFGIARTPDSAGGSQSPAWGGSDPETWRLTSSRDGALAGTPRYMSPEQLRGGDGDGRADQFAWGVMAYELLAGAPPWAGDTLSYTTLLDTLEREPVPLARAAPGIQHGIQAIVHRALAKNPDARFPSMDAVAAALGAELRPKGRRTAIALAASAAGLALAAGAGYARFAPPSAPSFHASHVRRVTFGDACEEYPTFTPDGRTLLFDEARESSLVIAAMDLASGAERALTDGKGWDLAPQVSPDGARVAFLRAPPDGAPRTMIADIDGARPPRALCVGWMRPSFSPDGTAVWCGEGEHPTRVDIATGEVTRKLEMPPSALAVHARELADGRVLVLVPAAQTSLQGLGVFGRDGSMTWLLRESLQEALDVTPDGRFALTARLTPTGSRELISVPMSGGAPVPAAGPDIAPSQGFRIAPGRKAIAWSTCHEVTSVVRANEQGALVPLHEVHAWKETAAATIPGTRKVIVLSERSGENAPWIVDRDDREPPRRLSVPGSPRSVSVSPDGRQAAFAMADHGIVVAAVDGSTSRTLTSDAGDGKARFLRDGRTIVFSRAISGGPRRVFAVDVEGGDPRPLLEEGSTDPAPSPVDDRIAYLAGREATRKVPMIFDPRTGRSSRLSPSLGEAEGSYESLAFSGDGRRVGFIGGAAGNEIVEVDVASGSIARTIRAGTSTLLRLSYDGTDPVVGREQWLGNVWMADGRF